MGDQRERGTNFGRDVIGTERVVGQKGLESARNVRPAFVERREVGD